MAAPARGVDGWSVTPRRLGVLTTGRQDWGILRSTCRALQENPAFALCLIVGGMHCADRFGRTERLIHEDGFTPAETLPWLAGWLALDLPGDLSEPQRRRAIAAWTRTSWRKSSSRCVSYIRRKAESSRTRS